VILVDTSVWIDHLHRAEPVLVELLRRNEVAAHPLVIGELAIGSIARRDEVIALLKALPAAAEATHDEVLEFVAARRLHGVGLSLVDAHLLASVVLTAGTRLWTGDRRLRERAAGLSLAWEK
jgi:predicted nucleic acid-binding protein